MRTRVRFVALLAGALAVASAWAPAGAQEEYVPTFTRADLWLHANSSPIGNLDASQGRFLTWDATKPTDSQQAFYHGNNYEVFIGDLHDPVHFLTMKGTATGDLNTIAFDLYFTGWAQSTIGCGLDLSLDLQIDGKSILFQDFTGSTGYNNRKVDDTTRLTKFVLTNLWEASKQAGLAFGPDVQHEVYLNIQNFYACNEVTWQYDSADRPAGLIVNMPTPASGYFEVDVLDPPPPLA